MHLGVANWCWVTSGCPWYPVVMMLGTFWDNSLMKQLLRKKVGSTVSINFIGFNYRILS